MLWWTFRQLRSSSPKGWERALDTLRQRGKGQAVAILVAKFNESDERLRLQIAKALAEVGDPATLCAAICGLTAADGELQVALAKVLSGFREPYSLCQALCHAGKAGQATICAALIEIGPPAVEPLLKLLESSDNRTRSAAAHALRQIHDPRAIDQLMASMGGGTPVPSDVAIKSLVAIGEVAIDALVSALPGPKGIYAALALGGLRDVRAVAPLLEHLSIRPWPRFCKKAISALGAIGNTAAVAPLIAILKEDRLDSDEEVADALGCIGDPRAVEPLIALLNSDKHGPFGFARAAAAEALGRIGDARAVPHLLVALQKDARADVNEKAAAALGDIGDPAAIEVLLKISESSNHGVRTTRHCPERC